MKDSEVCLRPNRPLGHTKVAWGHDGRQIHLARRITPARPVNALRSMTTGSIPQ